MKKVKYDEYYQQEDYFGEPYPGLIRFFEEHPERGMVLDLGCGQGRDSIPLAKLGYQITAVDESETGIKQLDEKARRFNLKIKTEIEDIFTYPIDDETDIILLDSILHFYKKDAEKEGGFLSRLIGEIKENGLIVICMLKGSKREEVLADIIRNSSYPLRIIQSEYVYYKEANAEYLMQVILKDSQ